MRAQIKGAVILSLIELLFQLRPTESLLLTPKKLPKETASSSRSNSPGHTIIVVDIPSFHRPRGEDRDRGDRDSQADAQKGRRNAQDTEHKGTRNRSPQRQS